MNLRRAQDMVRAFHCALNQPAPSRPTLEHFRSRLRAKLILEEAQEFADAARAHRWVPMIDAICDLLYVTYGAAVEMGIDVEPFFAEVHRTNMNKVQAELDYRGNDVRKPPGWEEPKLAPILEYQCKEPGERPTLTLVQDVDLPEPKEAIKIPPRVVLLMGSLPFAGFKLIRSEAEAIAEGVDPDSRDIAFGIRVRDVFRSDSAPRGVWIGTHPDQGV